MSEIDKRALHRTISSLRRNMGRNEAVMQVTEALEHYLRADPLKAEVLTQEDLPAAVPCPECERRKAQTLARVRRSRARKGSAGGGILG